MSHTDRENLHTRLEERAYDFWRAQGSRVTHVRKIITREAVRAEAPFDAEALLSDVRRIDRQISLSTVYRTLAGLVECGLLNEARGPGERKIYVLTPSPGIGQSHIVCRNCGQVFPLDDPCLGLREGAAAQRQGFLPKQVQLRLEAECGELKETGGCHRRLGPSNGSDFSSDNGAT